MDCSYLLTTTEFPDVVENILGQRQMRHVSIPNLDIWLKHRTTKKLTYRKSFEDASSQPFAIFQSSGSTGLPKPIVVTHGTIAASDAYNARLHPERPTVFEYFKNKRCLVTMPQFHIAGLDFVFAKPCYYGMVPVFPPFDIPINTDIVTSMLRVGIAECCILPPSIIEDLAANSDSLALLSRLDALGYGGAPLAHAVGEKIRQYVKLVNLMGSTEMYALPTEIINQQAFDYLRFAEENGVQFNAHSEGLFELTIVRNPRYKDFQSVFYTYENLTVFHTQDLYSPHPVIANAWRYVGRADDIITLSNGEKINPIPMEKIIMDHEGVKSSLLVGEGRFQTGLLVEAKVQPSTPEEEQSMVRSLAAVIDKANKDSLAHGRLSKDLIVIASPNKPFPRSGKGTVQRRATLSLYRDELDAMYSPSDEPGRLLVYRSLETSPESIEAWLPSLMRRVGNWDYLGDDQDFFAFGMDSLQALNLTKEINGLLRSSRNSSHASSVTTAIVYKNPTLRKLTRCLHDYLGRDVNGEPDGSEVDEDAKEEMQALISQLSEHLETTTRSPTSLRTKDSIQILLTGSTGSMGCYLLSSLVRTSEVDHIYCLNRSSTAETAQREAMKTRGLQSDWDPGRVTFIHADLSRTRLGLGVKSYQSLLRNVTHILHNAWEVNFNLPLSSFSPQLQGVRHLIDFSAQSGLGAHIFFISSVSAAMGPASASRKTISEDIVHDWSSPAPMGYAQSKYVAERLLSTASQRCGVAVSIYRVGQVAGPIYHDGGRWNEKEWLPSLIKSSRYLGALPDYLGTDEKVDWIPVDVLSDIVVELFLGDSDSRDLAQSPGDITHLWVYNIVNPQVTSWKELLPTVSKYVRKERPETEVVNLEQWLARLEESGKKTTDTDLNPALNLLHFFQSLAIDKRDKPTFETTLAVSKSPSLAGLTAIKPEWMEKWLDQWSF